jgi:hypothetical protein
MKFGLMYNTGYHGTDPDQMIAVARHAANGTTRLVVPPASAELPGQREEISAFADRLGLG